jgi:CubicO group peptidase (beta-lactamase class C family)
MRRVFLSLSFLLVTGSLPGASDDNIVEHLSARLTELSEESVLPGFAVAVVTADGAEYLRGFGWADVENRIPYIPTTIQPIASISKTVIGVCLMHAVEQDQVTLDATVAGLVGFPVEHPEFAGAVITLRQLATHTSSIVDRPAAYRQAYAPGRVAPESLREYLATYFDPAGRRYAPENFGRRAPGEAYAYSNIGAALAALALERSTGSSFAELSHDVVFGPLGMKDTAWTFDAAKADRHAVLYDAERRPIAPYTLVTYPDGGLHTTCADLALYLAEMIRGFQGRGRLLSPSGYATLFAPQFGSHMPEGVPESEPESGIFWAIKSGGDIGHNGADPGVTTFLSFRPDAGIGAILLTNVTVESAATVRHVLRMLDALKEFGQKR